MRETKFRGKRIEDNQWVYGYYVFRKSENTHKIYDPIKGVWYNVRPETVGQYIGIPDKNGKEIYRGDIVADETTHNLEIIWYECGWGFRYKDRGMIVKEPVEMELFKTLEVIGNIWDNPELLK